MRGQGDHRAVLVTEERLTNLISDRITPRLLPEIEILPWRRTQALAVQVHPSPSRPHYLVREGLTGGAYVRVGSTNRRADSEMIEEFRRYAHGEVVINGAQSCGEPIFDEMNGVHPPLRV